MSSSWRTSLTIRSSALAEGSFWPWATPSVASVSNAKMTTCDRYFIGFSPCNYGAHAGHNFDAETRRFETLALGRTKETSAGQDAGFMNRARYSAYWEETYAIRPRSRRISSWPFQPDSRQAQIWRLQQRRLPHELLSQHTDRRGRCR